MTADHVLEVHTPFGRPVSWAEVAMVSDVGDTHELNDDRCLVITSRDLGDHASGPLGDFMLCVLADGATGSTFHSDGVGPQRPAGWRASQLAQAVFVERFLNSQEVDVLDRLKDGLRAADRALVDSVEGNLSTTLTALFISADGMAYAASIGDSVLLVLPPSRKTPADRRLKKLGYEQTTAVGSGDTTLSFVDENELIEQWWPNKEGGRTSTRLEPGTLLVLISDGISDNLPIDFIEHLLHRHALEAATVGLPVHTRLRRTQAQQVGGGSTRELGLDNMSAIVVCFHGSQRLVAVPAFDGATLVSAMGTHGGPPESVQSGQFGLVCLAGQRAGHTIVPTFLRHYIELEHRTETLIERLNTAFIHSLPDADHARFAALALDEGGLTHAFSSGWADIESLLDVGIVLRAVGAARDSLLQKIMYTPRLWASALAAVALFALVSTAFATGSVRPAPPLAATPPPGGPTPTPDTRPMLSFGGFELVPPAPPPPAPTATPETAVQKDEMELPPAAPAPAAVATPETCTNLLGLLCGAPPPRRAPPLRRAPPPPQAPPPPPARVGPSPVPAGDIQEEALGLDPIAPKPGSKLDDALQVANIADQNFQRGLTSPSESDGRP